jgi:phosphatidylinositol alpha-1,6-mannosyltransferase
VTAPASGEPRDATRPAGFPATVLALVDRGEPDDGIAYVGALLGRALAELAPRTRTITVFPDDRGADPTFVQRSLFGARLIAAGRRADCVLFKHVGVAEAQARIPRALRRPYAVFVHGAEAWDEAMAPSRRRALAGARVRIANSAHTAARVHAAHPEAALAEVCPLALLPEQDGGPVDGALVGSMTARTIVIAGRMNADARYKGHDELLDAWPAVLARRPDARLAIVGRGDDAKRLETKATRLGLAASVRFTGLVSEATLDAMLARAGAFALPGRAEGFGLAYLRAMRAAIPCIGGADDAAREVVSDGTTGVLVQPDDGHALAAALIGVLGDTVRRREMGEAGRARFEAHFQFERFRDRLGEIMRGSLSPSPRSL